MPTTWYYSKSGQQFGPFQLTQLQDLCRAGQLSATDMVWEEGSPQRVPVSGRPDLLALARPSAPSSPMPPPTMPPMSVSPRVAPSVDKILATVQLALWGVCAAVLVLGGLLFLVTVHGF